MNKDEHRKRHQELHNALDELLADFIYHTHKYPSKIMLLDFLSWSYEETVEPSTKITTYHDTEQ